MHVRAEIDTALAFLADSRDPRAAMISSIAVATR